MLLRPGVSIQLPREVEVSGARIKVREMVRATRESSVQHPRVDASKELLALDLGNLQSLLQAITKVCRSPRAKTCCNHLTQNHCWRLALVIVMMALVSLQLVPVVLPIPSSVMRQETLMTLC